MSLADLLNLGRKEAAKQPEVSQQASEKPPSSVSIPKLNQEELELLNAQVSAQSTELSREQAKREREEQIAQKRKIEEAAEQAAALAKRRRDAGVAVSLETWRNSEEIWYKSADPLASYPSVYVSDVPVDYSEEKIKDLHKTLGLNPDMIVGLKFLPFSQASFGANGVLQTGSIILRYGSDKAAEAAVDRMKGHPIRLSGGELKYLGARLAAAASWMTDRKQEKKKTPETSQQEELSIQKIRGYVDRVSGSGYGVIKSEEFGEVMWRQYELPSDLRYLQFSDPQKFQMEVQSMPYYRCLKDMEGKWVEGQLQGMVDGQLRATQVQLIH